MTRFNFGAVENDSQLSSILRLQQRNLEHSLDSSDVAKDGFVTVHHDLELLRDMNRVSPHIIGCCGDDLAGYALAMSRQFEGRIPVLEPMVRMLESIEYRGHPLNACSYIIMGQICVDKPYRGKGVFEGLYGAMARCYHLNYDLVITEVALRNVRSMRAHQKVGFQSLHRYRDPEGEEWDLIAWDWQSRTGE